MIRMKLLVGLSIALAVPACLVHGHGSMTVSTGVAVDVYQEPPAPRPETQMERPGFIWIKGRWNWANNQWVWIDGHWERQKANQVWVEGRWEKRGTSWHWIEGSWGAGGGAVVETRDHREPVVLPVEHPVEHPVETGPVVRDHREPTVTISVTPTSEPPAIRVEQHEATRSGFVWQGGRWSWVSGKWEWVAGHWERQKANQVWTEGRWERQGNTWIYVEGTWTAAPAGPVIRDHRH